MGQIAISNIVNISVSQAQIGAGQYNTSNIGLFTDEVPANSFGSLGYKPYVEPTDVAADFGTSSKTYQMALAIFSQQPNILNNSGQLIIITMGVASEEIAFSGVAASGSFVANYNGHASVAINYNDTNGQIQTKIRAIPGLGAVVVTGTVIGQTLTIEMSGVYGAAPAAFTVTSNTLMTSAPAAITATITTPVAGESLGAAITRTASLVQYFGVLVTETVEGLGNTDVLAAAAVIQALNKIQFLVSYTSADIQPGGIIDQLATGNFSQSRGLYYGDSSLVNGYAGVKALLMSAAYAGLGLSVNFAGSNTTITMNLKALNTIQPDPSMTQAIFNFAVDSGADIYPSIQGVPGVISNGANHYYDQVYNLRWFVGALQIVGFNYLAQTSTKIPQTEAGMDGLKGAYRTICEQAATNQYLAPGTWTSPTTFGNQADLYANIIQRGYYIYSQPIAQQLQADREGRVAPLVQIAAKEAGAIQKSNVLIFVNP